MSIKYTLLLGGRNPFFRDAIDPLHQEFKPTLDAESWEQVGADEVNEIPALRLSGKVTMDASVAASLIVGAIVFVSSWAGGKILDQFFEKKLQKAANDLLSEIDKESSFTEKQVLEYRHVVWYEDIGLGIVLRLRAKDKDVKKYKDALLHAHKSASEWVNTHGKQAPIHAYLIENGKCNIEPRLYQSIHQMDDIEGRKNHKKMMREFRVKNEI